MSSLVTHLQTNGAGERWGWEGGLSGIDTRIGLLAPPVIRNRLNCSYLPLSLSVSYISTKPAIIRDRTEFSRLRLPNERERKLAS